MNQNEPMLRLRVLRRLRGEVNPDASGAMVISARATQKCDVLILLDKGSNKESFTAEVKTEVRRALQKEQMDPK